MFLKAKEKQLSLLSAFVLPSDEKNSAEITDLK